MDTGDSEGVLGLPDYQEYWEHREYWEYRGCRYSSMRDFQEPRQCTQYWGCPLVELQDS